MAAIKEKQFKILAVDDNSKNIQIIGSVLREAGYAVGFALEGQQALNLLQDSNDFDLVLLDVNMPGLNGFETCKILRKNKKLKEIPVIFLTALNDPNDIIAGFDAGGQDYVTKPFNSKELLSRVKTHLDLKYSKDKLVENNLYLEKRVLERTKELNKAKLKAEESDRLKKTFLELINHEIRTPLSSIVGFSSIIAESNENSELLGFSQIIIDQNELLLKLLEDIIDSSLIASGSLYISNEIFDLNKLLNKLLIQYKTRCNPEVSLILNTPLEEIYIKADEVRIKQIFSNLILNAIKFTPKGTITIGYAINEESELVCVVKDTGIGISIENHQKIFKRFTKIDSFSQGTGIGLSLIKNIIDLFNGKIWLESEPEKGATFNFKIPLEIIKTASSKTVSKEIISADTKIITVLVVEDEEFNFLYLKELLDEQHMKVIHAINGKVAVDYCTDNKEVDIILMDINMPILNGYEATKQIKKINPQIPIIAQTAYTLPEDIAKTKEAGCDGYLSKPINKNELFEWIRKFS